MCNFYSAIFVTSYICIYVAAAVRSLISPSRCENVHSKEINEITESSLLVTHSEALYRPQKTSAVFLCCPVALLSLLPCCQCAVRQQICDIISILRHRGNNGHFVGKRKLQDERSSYYRKISLGPKLCYAVPCHAMLCHTMLCYAHAMPCYAVICHAMPCHAVIDHAML